MRHPAAPGPPHPGAHPAGHPAPAAESTASWLQRLADAHHLTPAHLLDGLAITASGRPSRTPAGSELHLDHTAQHRLAAFTRLPHHHLTRALPHLGTPSPAAGPGRARAGNAGGHAWWHRLDPRHAPLRAYPTCTLRRTAGTTDHARLCPRHQHWAAGPHHSLSTAALPELDTAYRSHRRLRHRSHAADAWTWAAATTTRWHDHTTHAALTARWRRRRHLLQHANPDVQPVTGSWTLLARDAVTYPETVTLARALAATPLFPATPPRPPPPGRPRLPRPHRPRARPAPPHPAARQPPHHLDPPPHPKPLNTQAGPAAAIPATARHIQGYQPNSGKPHPFSHHPQALNPPPKPAGQTALTTSWQHPPRTGPTPNTTPTTDRPFPTNPSTPSPETRPLNKSPTRHTGAATALVRAATVPNRGATIGPPG
ncbi:TniQ family protein [Kitasatospora cheerisanensis]|uniref:TniQ family protein n=1 Tax=Kitasatospora cheerisanensis TaxID=81942 RepID=UPI003CC5FFBE